MKDIIQTGIHENIEMNIHFYELLNTRKKLTAEGRTFKKQYSKINVQAMTLSNIK